MKLLSDIECFIQGKDGSFSIVRVKKFLLKKDIEYYQE